MNIIDQAILISASPDFIWRFVGDLSKNVDWQEGLTHISFLTTRHEGKGARWRYSTAKGHDVIVEIVVWYDRVGYEYQIVDGARFSSNLGRIRLQEIAEGTRVRWTFQYEPGGVFGGLRNSMGLKRSIAGSIQGSLRNLYQLIQKETGGISTHVAKASLREAPDVEERSSYQPRHPSTFVDEALKAAYVESEYAAKQPISYALDRETALIAAAADDDTKPNPVVQAAEKIQDSAPDKDKAQAASELIASQPPAPAQLTPEPASNESMIPQAEDSGWKKPAITLSRVIHGTADVSVFDVFGLQKPSEAENGPKITSQGPKAPDLAVSTSESARESMDAPMEEAEDAVEASAAMTCARMEIQLTGWRRISRRRKMGLRSRQ